MLHRLGDVDTASALALIQEQELSQVKGKSSRRDFTKETLRHAMVTDKAANQARVPQADGDDKLLL
jgi:hypothetical protein